MKKIFSLVFILLLTGCLGQDEEANPASGEAVSDDYTPQLTDNFSVNVRKGYEILDPADLDLVLPEDYVMGYGEVRLDDNYATTFTVHREALPYENITALTYTEALADNAENLTDYAQESFSKTNIDNQETAINKYTYSVSNYDGKVRAYQAGVMDGNVAYVLTCTTRAENGDDDVCQTMLSTFYLKN